MTVKENEIIKRLMEDKLKYPELYFGKVAIVKIENLDIAIKLIQIKQETIDKAKRWIEETDNIENLQPLLDILERGKIE